ncbi:MAG: hypothetical protein AB7P12_09315, partial [Alphaproteobacteria bacterium]
GPATAERETLLIKKREQRAQRMIFARAYWPGYRATLNGVEIPVRTHADFLVAIDLPAGAGGELVLSYQPPGWPFSLYIAGAALLMMTIGGAYIHVLGVPRRRRRMVADDEQRAGLAR